QEVEELRVGEKRDAEADGHQQAAQTAEDREYDQLFVGAEHAPAAAGQVVASRDALEHGLSLEVGAGERGREVFSLGVCYHKLDRLSGNGGGDGAPPRTFVLTGARDGVRNPPSNLP